MRHLRLVEDPQTHRSATSRKYMIAISLNSVVALSMSSHENRKAFRSQVRAGSVDHICNT